MYQLISLVVDFKKRCLKLPINYLNVDKEIVAEDKSDNIEEDENNNDVFDAFDITKNKYQ